ncbi:MAG: PilW family protein [Hydrogenophaga sp.]|uniref:PilW family protein n=1 Tax=Hydrogenophaga sp. TaxID=1904254 RepID=UPI00262EC4EB|nr:PilW family protein [Hydrogenophaga sp.]MDM7942481.1 PilW family protein [Hydrogenophaga sp.]
MMQRALPKARARHQAGVSLIELLVGLVIGALVSVAAIASFSATRSTSVTVSDSTRLHQDAALAFRAIGHHIRQAGAQQLLDAGGGTVIFNPEFEGYGSAQVPQSLRGSNGPNNGPDVLEISHDDEASLNPLDCLGRDAHPPKGIGNKFELVNGSLRCQGSDGGNSDPLVAGIEDFQVRYGVRTSDRLQYLDADASWTSANWNAVETVMVCLRLSGQAGGQAGLDTTGCNNENIANDGRIRRVFVRVFTVRSSAL